MAVSAASDTDTVAVRLSPHRVVADGPEDEFPEPSAPVEEGGKYVFFLKKA